jgi:hypothetical protein
VGTSLVLNNWIQDCAAGSGNHGTLSISDGGVNLDNGTIIATDAALDAILASQAAEAAGLEAQDWTAINGAYSESVADPDYLDSTTYMGAVNPDGSDPWWAGCTLSGSL